MSFKSRFGSLEDTGESGLGFVNLILIFIWSLFYTPLFQISAHSLFLKEQRTYMSFKFKFRALEDAGESWLEFCTYILILKYSMVFDEKSPVFGPCPCFWRWKVHFCPLVLILNVGGCLILIWILSMVFDAPMFQVLALSLHFEDARNIHVL